MAKGFTVLANTPKEKSKDEFDIEVAKEMIKGKSIVFCLPGRGCSYIFLKAFVHFVLIWCRQVQAFKFPKTIHPWLTLHVASVLVQMY